MMIAMLAAVLVSSVTGAPPGAGDDAPPITPEHTLQAPDGAELSWEAFGDDPVLVEFWGTWCGPCVAAIPHLNDIAEEMRPDGLRTLAVTFEEPATVEKFLKLRSMDAWVLCDTDKSMVEAFGVRSWPTSFLVKEGKILARTFPSALNADEMRKVFKGEAGAEAVERRGTTITAGVDPFEEDDQAKAIFQLVIREGAGEGGMIGQDGHSATMVSATPTSIVSWAWGVEWLYVVDETDRERTYDFITKVPPGQLGVFQQTIQRAIEHALGMRVTMEERPVTGYELRVGQSGVTMPEAPELKGGYSMQSSADGSVSISSVAMTIEQLAGILPGLLGAPVKHSIDDERQYFVELSFPNREPEQIIETLREQAGIDVIPFETTAEFAVVREPE